MARLPGWADSGIFWWVEDLDPGLLLGDRVRCGTNKAGFGSRRAAQGLESWGEVGGQRF